jgi:uncharacterized membrane protein YbhN (UPF0104 family)
MPWLISSLKPLKNPPLVTLIVSGYISYSWFHISWWSIGETYKKTSKGFDVEYASQNVDVAITSGYNGGAMAMGLITCICIFGVVWLEINKKPKP